MNKKIFFTGLRWLWLALLILALDRFTKQWVITHLCYGESLKIMPFIRFTYIYNPGAAFSFLADQGGWQCLVLSCISAIIVMVLLLMMYRLNTQVKLFNSAYAMIIGGALGNLLDRILNGMVIDFIDFQVQDWHWPIFNIADMGIFIGTIFIILKYFFLQ